MQSAAAFAGHQALCLSGAYSFALGGDPYTIPVVAVALLTQRLVAPCDWAGWALCAGLFHLSRLCATNWRAPTARLSVPVLTEVNDL